MSRERRLGPAPWNLWRGTLLDRSRRGLYALPRLGHRRQQPGRIGQRLSRAGGQVRIDEGELWADRLFESVSTFHEPPFETEDLAPLPAKEIKGRGRQCGEIAAPESAHAR
jgi:hypothetical protein